jgi:anaerobic ribonucleoside-triphosphate reductase activating protein
MIRVGSFVEFTEAMGPGLRACLWVAGCPMRCKGCGTPEFLSKESGSAMSVEDLCRRIDDAVREHGIEGVSFSGGEPFAQAGAVARIARHARSSGLSTQSWSGFSRKHLESSRAPDGAAELLAELDVLIDGPFVQRRMNDDPFRGSSNQVIHFLTDRYGPEDYVDRVIEAQVSERDGAIIVNGVHDTEPLRVALRLIGLSPDE